MKNSGTLQYARKIKLYSMYAYQMITKQGSSIVNASDDSFCVCKTLGSGNFFVYLGSEWNQNVNDRPNSSRCGRENGRMTKCAFVRVATLWVKKKTKMDFKGKKRVWRYARRGFGEGEDFFSRNDAECTFVWLMRGRSGCWWMSRRRAISCLWAEDVQD